MDSIDALLGELTDDTAPVVLGWHSHEMPAALQQQLAILCSPGGDDVDLLGRVDQQLGELFAEASLTLLNNCGITPQQINAIGSHGQTVRHRPPSSEYPHPFTLQIGDPNIIASRTGITTVADFRRADMAVGGHGAPLAPAFHKHVFSDPHKNRVIVNIGGIANITWLPAAGIVIGFDTGPGNRLLDCWSLRHLNQPYDDKGQWAAQHTSDASLLKLLKSHPFFAELPPKSSGREAFNERWLDAQLSLHGSQLQPGDIQSTLLDLSVETIAEAITSLPAQAHEIYICGGGASNTELMTQLQKALNPAPVVSTAVLGVDPNQVEALAFAWLAQRTLAGQPGNLPDVTGAREKVVLGGIYPGRQTTG